MNIHFVEYSFDGLFGCVSINAVSFPEAAER